MKMIVKDITTQLFIGDNEYPPLVYSLNLGVNALPTLSVGIPMGSAMGIKGANSEESTDPSKIKEGDLVYFEVNIGDQQFIFRGVVKSTGFNMALSNVGESKASFNVICEHELSYLGGLAIRDRIFVANGKPAAEQLDIYRDFTLRKGSVQNNVLLTSILNGSFKDDALTGLLAQTGQKTIPGLVLEVIRALYESETTYKSNSKNSVGLGRERDTQALLQLDKLAGNVIGGIPNKDISTIQSRGLFIMALCEGLIQSWGTSNGLTILMKAMNSIFFSMVPKQDGKVYLQQKCPVYVKENYSIPPSQILSVGHNTSYQTTPVAGIRLRVPSLDNNAHSTKFVNKYIVYPPEGASGLYIYIDTHQYDMWLRFASIYDKQKEPEGDKEEPKSHTGYNGTKKSSDQQKEAKKSKIETEADALSNAHTEIGKAIYALQKWQNNSIVLSVAWVGTINPGDIVKVDLTQATELPATIPKGVYYGYVAAIGMAGQAGAVTMSVQITNLRSSKDNEELGFKEYPIYEQPNKDKDAEKNPLSGLVFQIPGIP